MSLQSELFAIVDRIEATWLDLVEADFPQLVGTLTERQRDLAQIQDFDVSTLSAEARELLRVRLERILQKDRELRDRVEALRESLVKQAAELRLSRRGTEGYRRIAREPGSAFDRRA